MRGFSKCGLIFYLASQPSNNKTKTQINEDSNPIQGFISRLGANAFVITLRALLGFSNQSGNLNRNDPVLKTENPIN